MQSSLVVSKEKDKASSHISNFLKKEGVDPIDINLYIFEKAVGIEDVRNIQKKTILRPFRGKTKAVVLETYEGITTEAQNALLKVLEEPPANTLIIISTAKKELILPTILSRCKIIELNGERQTLSEEENNQYFNVLMSLSENGTGYRLKLAQDITKDKNEAILWLEKMIITARQQLLQTCNKSSTFFLRGIEPTQKKKPPNPHSKLRGFKEVLDKKFSTFNSQLSTPRCLNILVSLNKTYTVLKTTNVNPRLALENLFLSL